MSTAQEWLDRADALAAGATDGPWGRFHTHNGAVQMVCPDTDWYERQHVNDVVIATCGGEQDAEFIAASRTLVPAMSAALRAVLDLHVAEWDKDDSGDWGVCRECGEYLVQDPICQTVRAISAALGGQS